MSDDLQAALLARAEARHSASEDPVQQAERIALLQRVVTGEYRYGFLAGFLAGYEDGVRDSHANRGEHTD